MAIVERIRFLRNLHGATQKWLGIKLGFSEKTAETRVGQYEIGVRTPKDEMIKDIAKNVYNYYKLVNTYHLVYYQVFVRIYLFYFYHLFVY